VRGAAHEELSMKETSKVVKKPKVLIVDDDRALGDGIAFLLESKRIDSIQYLSGEEFMAAAELDPLEDQIGCVLLDVRMSGLSGMDVFYWLANHDPHGVMPVIFMTGHGELPMAVQVMKRGAFDFVQKPFDSNNLIHLVESAIKLSRERSENQLLRANINERLNTLTDKELIVMSDVYLGASNKDIAEKMGNSVRTVELHRAHVYEKMDVKNGIELARLLEQTDWQTKLLKVKKPA
jgi:two-component system response regulator DctR